MTGPTIALLGEAGPEKVIPLSRSDSSRPIVVNVRGRGRGPRGDRSTGRLLSVRLRRDRRSSVRETSRLMAWSDHVKLRLEVASNGDYTFESAWSAPTDPYKYRWTPAGTDAAGEPGWWELPPIRS